MTIYDHTQSPPRSHTTPCLIGKTGLDWDTDPASYPPGVYRAKEPDPEPDGMVPNGREVVNGESCIVWTAAPPVVPYFAPITRRQLRRWLLGAGIPEAAIVAQINDIPDATQRQLALIDWEDATIYERNHPLVAGLGAALGLSDAQLDTAFREAAKL